MPATPAAKPTAPAPQPAAPAATVAGEPAQLTATEPDAKDHSANRAVVTGPTMQEGTAALDTAVEQTKAALSAVPDVEVPTAATPGSQQVVDAIVAAAAQGQATFAGALTTAIADTGQVAAKQSGLVKQAGHQQAGQTRAAASGAQAQVLASVATETSAVNQAQAQGTARVAAWHADAGGRAGQAVASRAEQVSAAGQAQQEQVRDAGESSAAAAASSLSTAAGQAQSGGGAGGEAAEAKAEVNSRIGGEAATKLQNTVGQAKAEVTKRSADAAGELGKQATRAASTVAAEAAPLQNQLTQTASITGAELRRTSAAATAALHSHGGKATKAIAAGASEASAAVHGKADTVGGEILRGAAEAVAGTREQALRTATQARKAVTTATAHVAKANLDGDAAAAIAGEAGARLTSGYDAASEQAAATPDAVHSQLAPHATGAIGALTGAGAAVGEKIGSTATGFGAKVGEVRGSVTVSLGNAVGAATTAGDKAIGETVANLDQAVAGTSGALAQGTAAARTGLAENVTNASATATSALAQTQAKTAEGHRRVDSQLQSDGQKVQRSVLGAVGDWFAEQLKDLWNMMKSPSFWVGLGLGILLAPLGPLGFAIAGAVAGAVSGIEDNVRNKRPWYDAGAIAKGALIGGVAGLAMGLGVAALVLAGVEGAALTVGLMALSAVIGIVVNVATGERWDRGLLANLFLAWLFRRIGQRSGGKVPGGRTPAPGEGSPPGGRSNTKVPGLYDNINPNQHPPGYKLTDVFGKRGNLETVRTDVKAPDDSSGYVLRGYDPVTGKFVLKEAFLDTIPKEMRMVATEPEMLPGKGTPLETYLTMRATKLLEQKLGLPKGTVAGAKVWKMDCVVNERTVRELAKARRPSGSDGAEVPLNTAIEGTHSVQYAKNSITQTGGKILKVKVVGGNEYPARDFFTPEQLATMKLKPDSKVLSDFNIEMLIESETAPTGGAKPAVAVTVPPGSEKDEDQK